MSARRLIAVAGLGSVALLLAAFAFQYVGGLAPCKLCLWQRWPHAAAALIAVIVLSTGWLRLAWLGAAAALTTAGIGLYHVGVEQGWWEGPTTCSSGPISGLTADELFDQILAAPLVRCDEIAWQFIGISMAGWNMIIACVLAALWLTAARRV